MLSRSSIGLTFAGLCLLTAAVCSVNGNDYQVEYPDIPKGKPYKTEIRHESDVAMNGWYNAMKLFVKTIQPNKPPVETVYKYITGKEEFKMPQSLKQILELEKGFVACIIFGLLFIIIVPIVGIFLCMCRMCNNCGGKMVQAQKDNLDCRRRTYFFLLLGTFFFMVIAVISMYACNETMGKAIPITKKAIIDNIDDSQVFINNTYNELMFIVDDSLDEAVNGLFFTLDTINNTLGVGVKNVLNETYDTDEVFDKAYYVAREAQAVLKDLLAIVKKSDLFKNETIQDLKPVVEEVTEKLKAFVDTNCQRTALPAIEAICGYPSIVFNYTDAFANFDGNVKKHLDEVEKVLKGNLTTYVAMAENEFNYIPNHVRDYTVDLRDDIKDTINTIRQKIRSSPQLDHLKDVKSTVISSTDDARQKVDDIMGSLEKYNNYRWYAGLFVCLMVSICVGLIFAGMCCGLVGHKSGALPTQRSVVSNAGGISLMAAVGFMFLFASFLMIVTTAFFLVGAHGEAFVCDIMYNDIPLLDKIKDLTTEDLTDEPFIKNMVISNVLKECKEDKPAYMALGLQNQFNISKIKSLVNRDKINNEINTLNISLTGIDVLPENLEDLLNTYAEGVNVNFTDYIETLETSVLNVDISKYVDDLDEIVKKVSLPPGAPDEVKQGLTTLKDSIGSIQAELRKIMPTVGGFQAELLTFIKENKHNLGDFHENLQQIVQHLLDLKDKILSGVMDVVRSPIHDYKDLILNQVDQYIDYLEDQATKNIAKCKPLWNIYDSVRFVLCKTFLDPFNGFWFGLGWCLAFFIPALIFSLKLARHYRKMKYTEFEGAEADCDLRGTERDSSWEYGQKGNKKDAWDNQEMQPIHAYDNKNFHPDSQHPNNHRLRQNHEDYHPNAPPHYPH